MRRAARFCDEKIGWNRIGFALSVSEPRFPREREIQGEIAIFPVFNRGEQNGLKWEPAGDLGGDVGARVTGRRDE